MNIFYKVGLIILPLLFLLVMCGLIKKDMEFREKEKICIEEYGGITKDMIYCIYTEGGNSKSIKLGNLSGGSE